MGGFALSLGGLSVDEGSVPLSPSPVNPHPEVAVLPMKMWVEAKSLRATLNNPKIHRMTL